MRSGGTQSYCSVVLILFFCRAALMALLYVLLGYPMQSIDAKGLLFGMQIADGIAGFNAARPQILMVSSAAVERNAIIGDDGGVSSWLHILLYFDRLCMQSHALYCKSCYSAAAV